MVFAAGNNANPKGRGSGSANFVDRLHYWVASHTYDELFAIYTNKKKFNALPLTDRLCCQRLYEATQEGGGNTMEQLFDRLLGKPSQHTTIDARVLAQVSVDVADRKLEARKEAESMLAAIAARGASAVPLPAPVTIEHEPVAHKERKPRMTRQERIERNLGKYKANDTSKG